MFWFIHILNSVPFHWLKGMQNSKLVIREGYHLSKEGIGGVPFPSKMVCNRIRGWTDPRADPPRIKLYWSTPPPPPPGNYRSRSSSSGTALVCRADGRGVDLWGRTTIQGLRIIEKWWYTAFALQTSHGGPVSSRRRKTLSSISSFLLNTLTI